MFQLLAGADKNKDQSYFLCQLNQHQLSKALFPIGHLQKSEVREIARELDLVTADKKDSQGLCFIGKVKLPVFLQQQLAPKTGDIIELPKSVFVRDSSSKENRNSSLMELTEEHPFSTTLGQKIGEHNGAHYFTIGQRKGLDVGGTAEALFVLGTDTKENILYTGQGTDHPGLYRTGLRVRNEDVHWIRPDLRLAVGESKSYMMRIRYRQPLFKATLHQEENMMFVVFDKAQKSVAPGQFAAWYDSDELIGSGTIK
jgi:tRNA-specific 2-thiouridylase